MEKKKERWIHVDKEFAVSEKVDAFIADIIEVYKKHNMSISHQDGHGAFIVERGYKFNAEWLKDAIDDVGSLKKLKEKV